jgi:hypothetical protein
MKKTIVEGYVIAGKLGDRDQYYSPTMENWQGNVQNLRMSDIQSVQTFAEQICKDEENQHITNKRVAKLTITIEDND